MLALWYYRECIIIRFIQQSDVMVEKRFTSFFSFIYKIESMKGNKRNKESFFVEILYR